MTDTLDPTELDHLRRAIQISVDARAHGNHPFGAILVTDDGRILEAENTVLTDRDVDSTLAYQGAGRSLDIGGLEFVARWATSHLRPHLTVLLDVDPALGLLARRPIDRMLAFTAALEKGQPVAGLIPNLGAA